MNKSIHIPPFKDFKSGHPIYEGTDLMGGEFPITAEFRDELISDLKLIKNIDVLETLTPDEIGEIAHRVLDRNQYYKSKWDHMPQIIKGGAYLDFDTFYYNTLKILIYVGMNLDTRNEIGGSLLTVSVAELGESRLGRRNFGYTLATLLLSSGANVDHVDDDTWTPLMWAIEEEWLEMVELLINYGANINYRSSIGNSPISRAVSKSLSITTMLIDRGVDLELHAIGDNGEKLSDIASTTVLRAFPIIKNY